MKEKIIKNHLGVLYITFVVLAGVLVGCDNLADSDGKPSCNIPPADEVLCTVKDREITSLYTVLDPAAGASIAPGANVMLLLVGGPIFDESFLISNKDRKANLPPGSTDTYVRVLVRQEHMIRFKNNTLPKDRFITPEEASEINLYSVATTYALAEYFQNRGHKVSLYSSSFGSFIVPEMYRQYGDAPFEKVLISVGRLDIPKAIYESFFNGTGGGFEADGTTLRPLDPVSEVPLTRTQMRLQADLGRNQYTNLLANKDLSKIVYFFGGKDTAVGRLTNAEVAFLTGRNDVIVTPEPSATSPTTSTTLKGLQFTESKNRSATSPTTSTTPDQTENVSVFFPGVPADPSTTPPTPAILDETRNYTINALHGIAGHAKVWYSINDGHSLDSLLDKMKQELNASFGP